MEKHSFQTPFGEIWLWGQPRVLSDDRPVVLFINGAFSTERPRSFELPDLLPEAAVLNAHLPGQHSPETVALSVGVYGAAFSAALEQIGRPAVVVGASVGALVAMAMRSPLIRGLALIEAPLRTGKLWPLVDSFRAALRARPGDAGLKAFLWTIFGISETTHEDRDYGHLLAALDTPAWALFGGDPLYPARATDLVPSLVDEPERQLFTRHPGVRTWVIPGVGHNLPGHAIAAVAGCARDLLQRTGLVPAGVA